MPASPDDGVYMRRALELAARGWGQVSPNPLVGAVVVSDGTVIGEGWHAAYGQNHAEVMALFEASDRARGATIYVTLEPCAHHGKTPPCTDAIRRAGVARLVYAAADPNPEAKGGADLLSAAGVQVTGGIDEQAVHDLDPAFFHSFSPSGKRRPYITLKLALSQDARIADYTGRSGWLTGESARAEVHRLRAGHDAIAVGSGTVIKDDPLLTTRGFIQPRLPLRRIIFDRTLCTPPGCRIVASASEAPTTIVCERSAPADQREALESAGVQILPADDLEHALQAFTEMGIRSVFCEGGAQLASALLHTDMVDRLQLFYAPLFLGPKGLDPFAGLSDVAIDDAPRWRHVRTETFAPDTLITLART